MFDIYEDPSVSAAHCQLPFQGSLYFLFPFVVENLRTRLAVSLQTD